MSLKRYRRDSTQTEDKVHSFSCPINDSFRNIFCQHVQVQPQDQITNKDSASSPETVEIPFDACSPSMKGGNLSPRHWCDDLSSLHSETALSPDTMQIFDHAGLLLTLDDFNSGGLFQNQKEGGAKRSPRSSPNAWTGQTYKYHLPSTAEARRHKSDGPTTLKRKKAFYSDSTRPPISASSSSSSPSPSSPPTNMAYQDHWFNQRFENYDIQQAIHPSGRQVTSVSPFPQPLSRRESLTHLSAVSRESDKSPLDSTSLSTTGYSSSNLMSHRAHSPSVPTTCQDSTACRQYSDHPGAMALPVNTSTSTPPLQQQLLRSQPFENPPVSSWYVEPIDTSVFQYSPTIQQQGPHSAPWWPMTSQPMENRSLQESFPNGSYPTSSKVAKPMPLQNNHHHRFTHTSNTLQNSGLMIRLDTSSPGLSSMSEPGLSGAPLSGSEPALTPSYTPLTYMQPQHRYPSSLENSHSPVPISHSAPALTTISRSMPPTARKVTAASTTRRSAKTRQQQQPHMHQRRGSHCRKAASFSGRSISKNPKGQQSQSPASSNGTDLNDSSNKTPISVSFVNFTPDDSHKLLSGVAPSGSSKTKARRDQEAREKRRKLSEAALMAVRRAGGDIESLEAVFC